MVSQRRVSTVIEGFWEQFHKNALVLIINILLVPVVQKVDSEYLSIGFPNTYPLDSDLSCGWRYPKFEQLGPAVKVWPIAQLYLEQIPPVFELVPQITILRDEVSTSYGIWFSEMALKLLSYYKHLY